MFRTRFKNEIVAEFLPPLRPRKKQKLIVLCDGMPSIPRKQSLAEFIAAKGFWVIYPRYRGAWESGGEFLAKSPHEDIFDVLDELPKELEDIAFGQRFRLAPHQVFVIGGSFGGAAAILLSRDRRVTRVVANCPVVDWSILDKAEKAETSKANYAEYMVTSNPNASPALIPIGHFGSVDDVASVAVMLAMNDYMTGQTISVNGGWYMS
ncbi:MAG: prolyl oligopeptidase family serine peptidase [Candidatus Sulfotelmatobacter sp.]